MPQAPIDQRWLDEPATAAMTALQQTVAEFHGDPQRLYLTGMSMGGYGTVALAFDHPQTFAAIVPVCGGILPHESAKSVRQLPGTIGSGDPYEAVAVRLKNVPIWLFHGALDEVIPVTESRQLNEALLRYGTDTRYTEYPDAGHNVWDAAYGSEELWIWLLKQQRPKP